MKLGFLYAGQGSQHPGMGADLYEAYPAFRAVIDSAQVDFDLKEVSFTDSQGVINQTRYTQPCMVAFAAGLTAVLREQGVTPAVAAGLSLGEYSALHAAGVFDAAQAVKLVAFRGKAMEEAAAGRESAMIAVLGLDRAPLQEACEEAGSLGCVVIANYNCPGQLVIGGEKAAVEKGVPVVSAGIAGLTGWCKAIFPGETGPASLLAGEGDRPTPDEILGNLAPTVFLAASLQAALVLQILTGKPVRREALFFDLEDGTFTQVVLDRRP